MAPITAQEEFAKNNKLKRKDIEYLRDWMSKQPHLPTGITDEQLILFLYCCQYSLEACKQTIEAYYTIRTHAPELFGNRDPRRKEIQQTLSILEMVTLPKRDQHGNIVMAGRLIDDDVSKFSYEHVLNTWFMLQDITLRENGAVPGFVFVVDMKGTSLGHAAKMHLATVKKYYMYIQEAFPGNVVSNHLVNANPVSEAFLNLSKPFLNKELARKIFVHSSCTSLHKHVTKDALPKEFGGNLDSMSSYHIAARNFTGATRALQRLVQGGGSFACGRVQKTGKGKEHGGRIWCGRFIPETGYRLMRSNQRGALVLHNG